MKTYPTKERYFVGVGLAKNNMYSQTNDFNKRNHKPPSVCYDTFYSSTNFLIHLIFSLNIIVSFILSGSEGKVLELSDRYF